MSCGKYDSIHAVMDFTEVLKNEPGKAFDFITCNAYRLEKDDIVNILKEVLYSVKYHTEGHFYGSLYADILCAGFLMRFLMMKIVLQYSLIKQNALGSKL